MDALTSPRGTAQAAPSGIDGVWTRELAEIPTPGGPVLHMLRRDAPLFTTFGEIYFSCAAPGAVKAWKLHRLQSQNFAVPQGMIQVVVYDEREGSPSRGVLRSFRLGRPGEYRLLHIPPGVWYGFACLGEAPARLANCADLPHAPDEAVKLDRHSARIPYIWRDAGSDAHDGGSLF
jgi:dTDP-4-dehydrorhamnose 3,5-epimerase